MRGAITRLETSKLGNVTLINVDEYLTFLRWAAVISAIPLSVLDTFSGDTWLPFPLALGVIAGLNLLLCVYGIRQRAFATGRPDFILISDAAQAGLATLLTGGYHSMFFPLFVLLVVELALAFPVRLAAAWILSASALHVAAAALNQAGEWTALGAYITGTKLLFLMIAGALALAFSEQIRREERSRMIAEEHATQLAALHELFFNLEQPLANLGQTMPALLEGSGHLLHAEVSMIFLSQTTPGCWQWSAGQHAVSTLQDEIHLADWGWLVEQQEIYTAGPVYGRPIPDIWVDRDLQMVAGIRLNAPTGDANGALIIGRRGAALNEREWLLLRALAREAELAVRNSQLYASEHAQVQRLQQFEQARRSFLSAIAHELHTPLTVLKTLLPNLSNWDQVPSATRQEILAMVKQNLARLESLTSDFLESTRLEAGAVLLHRQPLDLSRRAQHVLNTLEPLFLSKQQKITLETPSDLPQVNADPRRVDQILSSLLHNAYKFTPAGGMIRVVMRVDGQAVCICIEDNGPGVPIAMRDHIFDKFYSAPAESGQAGVGLGLYICRELVSLHGGRLWYEERSGGGSRFCFTLPVAGEEIDG